jgi:hypothetical protein
VGSPPLEEDPSGEATTAARRGYRVGTLELTLPPGEPTTQLFRDLAILKSRRQAPTRERDSSRWNRAVAVGGIVQGLLDFQRIEDYELADVFAEVDIDAEDETMLAFHKGTLLSLAAAEPEEDEPTDQPGDDAGAQDEPERVPPIGVDPYLAVPNIVLPHDEQRPQDGTTRGASPLVAAVRAALAAAPSLEGAGIDRGHPERPR